MEKMKQMDPRKLNMVITLIEWTLLCAVCMGVMLYVALHKTIVISSEVGEQMTMEAGDYIGGRTELMLVPQADSEGCIRIPLTRNTKADNVVVESRYWDRELWVYIEGVDGTYYAENMIQGDVSSIVSAYCDTQRGGVILKFQMDNVWEYYSTMEYSSAAGDQTMAISFFHPKEVYSQVVVIDPMGGGRESGGVYRGYAEKTLSLQIAALIADRIEHSDIKLYFTRQEDVEVSEEDRLGLVEAVDADLYIRIAAGMDEDSANYGIQGLYNETYFIPDFGNVEWADILTRNVTIASSNRAVGLLPAGSDSILYEITIPAAQINVGYLTNGQEAELLGQAAYREKLAQGIADAIEEAYNRTRQEADQ
ncbi:MAG: N-acetylmuramoyl-L-alanine amidase [Candidatus Gastranaerophilales bacterium]|nr:N-acetylmuramoyl-L-alanine amidase [Candidatus Gastranaerophilales bacterium]